MPPVTSPAWRCYATGKDPSKLDTYWWRQLDRETSEYVGAPDVPLTSKCYWEYLSDWGEEVAVLGVPLNTPPREVTGKLVLGGPYANEKSYTYPNTLQDEIEQRFDYKLHPSTDPASADKPTNQRIVDDLEAMINQRFDVAEWMLEDDPALLNVTLFYINHLQHMAWKSEGVKHLWQVIDSRLGNLLEKNHNIIIHSDHGLHQVTDVFYLNAWLESNGYIQLSEKEESRGERAKDNIRRAVDTIVNHRPLSNILPRNIVEALSKPGNGRIVDASNYENRIDFEESDAVGLPHGLIYILEEERKEILHDLQEDLEGVTIPGTSNRAFKSVRRLKEVYSEWDPNTSPDLFTEWTDGVEVKDINSSDTKVQFGPPQKFKADNHPMGILLAAGPQITPEELSYNASLYDIAPTILHLMGHPVPDDMDGDVVKEIFKPDSNPRNKPVQSIEGSSVEESSGQTRQEVEDRLKDLGYME